ISPLTSIDAARADRTSRRRGEAEEEIRHRARHITSGSVGGREAAGEAKRSEHRRRFKTVVLHLLYLAAEFERMAAVRPCDVVVKLIRVVTAARNAAAGVGRIETARAAEQWESAEVELRQVLLCAIHVEARFRE